MDKEEFRLDEWKKKLKNRNPPQEGHNIRMGNTEDEDDFFPPPPAPDDPLMQIKKHSLSEVSTAEVDSLTEAMVKALNDGEEVQKKSPFGLCGKCGKEIKQEASVVNNQHFHPECFRCFTCDRILGTETFFVIDGKNYCEKDKDSFLETCLGCSKSIEGETVRPKESGKPYHPECFKCSKCSEVISGKYYNQDEDNIICEKDYKASREKCNACGDAIMDTILKALNGSYHPTCFTCSMCPKSLDGIPFYMGEQDKPQCQECFAKSSAKKCSGCESPILEDCLISKNTGGYFHRQCYQEQRKTAS